MQQPPALLLHRSGSPWTLTGPVECAVGVRAGGCAPACSPRRDRRLRGTSLACGFACWPSSSSSGSASPIAMLAPPQARRSEPGEWRPRRGRRHGQQCFPCRGSRAESAPRQLFSLRGKVHQTPPLVLSPSLAASSLEPKREAVSPPFRRVELQQLRSEFTSELPSVSRCCRPGEPGRPLQTSDGGSSNRRTADSDACSGDGGRGPRAPSTRYCIASSLECRCRYRLPEGASEQPQQAPSSNTVSP